MARIRGRGFIERDSLSFEPIGQGQIEIKGTIWCAHDIRIEVTKVLEILEDEGSDPLVQTSVAFYDVILGSTGRIVAYHSPHPTHNCFHHRHAEDPFVEESKTVTSEVEIWPTLGQVIEEAEEWAHQNYANVQARRGSDVSST